MRLKDIKTLRQLAKETGISYRTLADRIESNNLGLIEGIDYLKLGKGQATLLSPEGVEKIIK